MATVKAKHAPAQPRSSLQLAARARAVDLSRTWAANAHTTAWNDYAAAHPYLDGMGLTIRATGLNWFLGCNSRLVAAGQTQIDEPPATPAPSAPTGVTATGGANQITVAWTDPGAADDYVDIWLDGPRSAGRKTSIARIKHNQFALGNAADPVITGLQPGTYTVWIRSFSKYTGLVSAWVTASCVVTT